MRAARTHTTLRRLDVSCNWLGPRAMAACIQVCGRGHILLQPELALSMCSVLLGYYLARVFLQFLCMYPMVAAGAA